MSHTPSHDSLMTISADVTSLIRQSNPSMGKYINCIASEDMKITGSGEYGSPRLPFDQNKRLSWQSRENSTRHIHIEETPTGNGVEVNEREGGSNIHFITPGEGVMESNTSTNNLTSTNRTNPNITTNTPTTEINNTETITEIQSTTIKSTPGSPALGSPRLGTPTQRRTRGGSKGVASQMKSSLDLDGGLAEVTKGDRDITKGDRDRVGIGSDLVEQAANKLSAILLHIKQPPASPPQTPLTHSSSSNISISNLSRKSLRSTRELKPIVVEEGQPSNGVVEMKDVGEMEEVGVYPDIEPYEPDAIGEHTVMVGKEEENVGVGIAEPKADSMVRKEIVRISIVAIIALLVVLLFVLT